MIKDFFHFKKRKLFNHICRSSNLNLNYYNNKGSLFILNDIFIEREYSQYFPFYEKSTIVDIGAHYGYFSIFASKNSDPNSKIIAFEPDSSNYNTLIQNLKDQNIGNVTPHNCGVSGCVGKSTLFRGDSMNNSLISNYQLLKSDKSGEMVSTIDLETLFEQNSIDIIDFLKVDCEGAEYSIFLNINSNILDRVKTISMEFHDLKDPNYTGNRLVSKLESCGFIIKLFRYNRSSQNLNYGRLIAVNRKFQL